jgi:anti-anti-sigma factor
VDVKTSEPRPAVGPFLISIQRSDGVVSIAPTGELDIATSPRLDRTLREYDGERVILDLRGLTFMDSSGLHVIATANSRARANGSRLTLLRGPYAVQRVIEIIGLDRELDFATDASDGSRG